MDPHCGLSPRGERSPCPTLELWNYGTTRRIETIIILHAARCQKLTVGALKIVCTYTTENLFFIPTAINLQSAVLVIGC